MKDFSVKKAVLNGIGVLAALMMLLALCVPLVVGTEYNRFVGYITFSDCGFDLLDFSSDLITRSYQWGAVIMGLLGYLQLLGSLALIGLNIVALLRFTSKRSWLVAMITGIVSVVACFLYMLEGIIYTTICVATYNDPFTTLAFLPFIFSILIGAALLICKFLIKEPKTAEEAPLDEEKQRLWEIPEREGVTPLSPEKADLLAMNFKKFIPEESLLRFREALSHVGEDQYSRISMAPVKDPTTVLLFSIFLGGLGVDRFYIGDTGLGVAKLLVGGLTFGIWPIIDIYFCYQKVKEQNLEALLRTMRG